MFLLSLITYCLALAFIVTDALYTPFGRIRKRKHGFVGTNITEQVDNLEMYFTRRTTPWPRMTLAVDPSIEAYYEKKLTKDYFIKQAYFKKEKAKKKGKAWSLSSSTRNMNMAPALDKKQ